MSAWNALAIRRLMLAISCVVLSAGIGGCLSESDHSTGAGSNTAPSDDETVIDFPPVVAITAPADGSVFSATSTVELAAEAEDPEDGNLTSRIRWQSSIDGDLLDTGGKIVANLSPGEHVIIASGVDSADQKAIASIKLTLDSDTGGTPPTAGNTAPIVSIAAPSGSNVAEGKPVTLIGSATDSQDGNISSGLTWKSSLNGELPVRGDQVTLTLSAGLHVITASVTDSGGLSGSSTISVNVMSAEEESSAFYIDGSRANASDSNPGTEAEPWKTVVHAGEVLKAGETVFIKAGVYTDGDVEIANSGTAGREIVFAAYPGDERKAVLDGGTVNIKGKSYIQIRGLKIQNTDGRGIYVQGPDDAYAPPVRNITLSGNHTYNTYSSGISVWGVRYGLNPGDFENVVDIIIEDNLIEKAVNGGSNECITLSNGVLRAYVRNNELRNGGDPSNGGEGIDFKNGVRDSYISNNYIHGLTRRGIYIDGGRVEGAVTSNIRINGNLVVDDPDNAIYVMSEGVGDVDGIYMYNNVVLGADRNGMGIYEHPSGAGISVINDIQFINNTVIDTGREGSGWGGIQINHDSATNIVIRNNIALEGNGFDIRGNSHSTIDHNFCRDSVCELHGDPGFINPTADPATMNYNLKSTSAAIDAGNLNGAPRCDRAGVPRPQGAAVDIGAYEHIF